MPSSPLKSTAVVTVSYNSGPHLCGFLSSLRANESPDVEIVVADNGSLDLEEIRRACATFSATLLELGANLGYGGAMNRAISSLGTHVDSVLISNPDVHFKGEAIESLVRVLVDNPQAGAVGPRVLNTDQSIYPSARELPSLRTGIGHALLGRVWRTNPWTTRYLSDVSASTTQKITGWLSGSCLLVRRDAFESIGGFDKVFFMYFEDVDLGYRMGKAGWLNIYEPAAVVTHTGAHSTRIDSSKMVKAHHDSAYQYLSRKYSNWYLGPLRLLLRGALGIRSRWLSRK